MIDLILLILLMPFRAQGSIPADIQCWVVYFLIGAMVLVFIVFLLVLGILFKIWRSM